MNKVLVLGQGGREHAIVKALRASSQPPEIFCSPGNAGMCQEATCVPLSGFQEIAEFIQDQKIEFVIVGPENLLVDGAVDELRTLGVRVLGPNKSAARLEGSKSFSKEFLVSAGVRTAPYQIASSLGMARLVVKQFSFPVVIKFDGLAAGKGVFICKDQTEVDAALEAIFVEKRFSSHSEPLVVIEQFQKGVELSYLILTNGREYEPLPFSRDHKRLLDKDQGPNTGGMGVIAPVTIDPDLDTRIRHEVVEPVIRRIRSQKDFDYRGVLYFGLMVTDQGPSVLEFNVRLGDPEAQALLPLLDGDWLEVFMDVADGVLPHLSWRPVNSCCVVVASEGYPDQPQKGQKISGVKDFAVPLSVSHLISCAVDKDKSNSWIVNGGRVLNSVGIGRTAQEARDQAYKQIQAVQFDGRFFRKDIGV